MVSHAAYCRINWCFFCLLFFTLRSESTSHAAHYGGFTSGLLLGIVFLRNPHLHWREKYIIIPAALALACCALFGGIFWTFTHWPPKYMFHLESRTYTNPPCCWQVADCHGLRPSDYEMFKCKMSSGGNIDGHITSTLTADGIEFDTCSAMEAAVERNV